MNKEDKGNASAPSSPLTEKKKIKVMKGRFVDVMPSVFE